MKYVRTFIKIGLSGWLLRANLNSVDTIGLKQNKSKDTKKFLSQYTFSNYNLICGSQPDKPILKFHVSKTLKSVTLPEYLEHSIDLEGI